MRQEKEIATVLETRGYSINNIICETMKEFKFKTLIHQSGIKKMDGYSASEIITILIMLPLMALKNVHQLFKSEFAKQVLMKKDALYRMKNNERHPWRNLLYLVAKAFQRLTNQENKQIDPKNKSAKKIRAFIVDDTTDQRTGYKIENISYVFDHVLNKSVYGFKILVLSFFDGKSNIPLDFTTHTEKKLEKKKTKAQYKKEVNPKSNGGKRRKEAGTKKTDQALAMIKRAVKHGFVAEYVLADAWFTSHKFIQTIREIKNGAMHVIAGVRKDNRKYDCDGHMFNAKEIITQLKAAGSESRNRKWNVRYYEKTVQYEGIGLVKLFICRYPGQRNWRVFITTNISLSFVEMMEIYGIRWTIEVMFREAKQHLQLGGCQSQDFDAQIASTTISLILYTFLAYLKRMESYETVGEIFRIIHNDLCEKNLVERLWELFEELLAFIIDIISEKGSMDITLLKQSEEYRYAKEVFASSFLFEQIDSVNKSA